MALRDAIDKHQKWVALGAAIVLIMALGSMAAQHWPASWRPGAGGRPMPLGQWFYELSTGELRVVRMPAGGAGGGAAAADAAPDLAGLARAHVFSCRQCADAQQRFVGVIEPVEGDGGARRAWAGFASQRAIMAQVMGQPIPPARPAAPPGAAGPRFGRSVRAAEPSPRPQWVELASARGKRLTDAIRARCPAGNVEPCTPEE